MPNPGSWPTLFDDCLSISISDLRKWGYLKMNIRQHTIITWSNQYKKVTSRCPLWIAINENEQFIELNYKCNETSYNYKIYLESLESNLGKGKVWYFICPFTHRRCRKLHLISERFMHRSNLPSGMYECQTKSKKWRSIERIYGNYFDLDKHYEELYSKHFKSHYNGKPTKKYLRLMRKIQYAERIPVEDIERLMII